ncbi:MAG: hypothetical protein K8U57_36140 [Planctomycetes bacterium]|nr:hypothetical protein [Planctomycetota bacterium]
MNALEMFQEEGRNRTPGTSHVILQPSIEAECILKVIDRMFATLSDDHAKLRSQVFNLRYKDDAA